MVFFFEELQVPIHRSRKHILEYKSKGQNDRRMYSVKSHNLTCETRPSSTTLNEAWGSVRITSPQSCHPPEAKAQSAQWPQAT